MRIKSLSILFLTDEPYPTNRSLLVDLFNSNLVSRGHKVTWIMRPQETCTEYKQNKWATSDVFLTYNISGNLFLKIQGFVLSLVDKYRITKKLIEKDKPDIIQVRNGIFESLIAIKLSRKYGIKFSFMLSSMHGFFDDSTILMDYRGLRYYYNLFLAYLRIQAYRYIIQRSDYFQPITKWMSIALNKNKINPKKVQCLPICSSDIFLNFKKDRKSKSYSFVYSGSIRASREISFIIKSFKILNVKYSQSSLLIIGGEDFKEDKLKLNKLIKSYNLLDNIHITGKIDRDKVPYYLNKSLIALSPIPPNMKFKVSSPSKMVEYMAMRLPVIANQEIHDQRYLIKESNGGILTKYDVNAYSKAMIFLYENKILARKIGKSGFRWIKKNRNYDYLSKKLEEDYIEIIS